MTKYRDPLGINELVAKLTAYPEGTTAEEIRQDRQRKEMNFLKIVGGFIAITSAILMASVVHAVFWS